MADQVSGIDVMRRRIERASRQAPPSRRPRPADGEEAGATLPDDAPVEVEVEVEAASPSPSPEPAPAVAPVRRAPAARAAGRGRGAGEAPARARLAPDLPPVNLAIRVRKPLDDGLADTIHALRGLGVRTSKVELIEMLLWESAGSEAAAVRERLRTFREWAPRGAGARLDDSA